MLLLKLRLMLRFSWGLGLSFLRELGSLLGLRLSDALRDDRFTSPRSRLKLLLRLRLRLGLRRLEPRPLSLSRSLSRQSSS